MDMDVSEERNATDTAAAPSVLVRRAASAARRQVRDVAMMPSPNGRESAQSRIRCHGRRIRRFRSDLRVASHPNLIAPTTLQGLDVVCGGGEATAASAAPAAAEALRRRARKTVRPRRTAALGQRIGHRDIARDYLSFYGLIVATQRRRGGRCSHGSGARILMT